MKTGKSSLKFLNEKESSRHHYIPELLIKGFTNSENKIYIYDKIKDRIEKNPRSPKSIFFETDRNTVNVTSNIDSSFIEEHLYSPIDSKIGPVIEYFKKTRLNDLQFELENIAKLELFIITLFWRIPYSDPLVESLMNQMNISDSTIRKIKRSMLAKYIIDELSKSDFHDKKDNVNIREFANNELILGDNPIVFSKNISKLEDLGNTDYVFAISSNRIYCKTKEQMSRLDAFFYNAAIIDQSVRYVCSSNINTLNLSMITYNELKRTGGLEYIRSLLFTK